MKGTDEIDIMIEKITNFIDMPTKNNIENPNKIIVKPVPKSGCVITKKPGIKIKKIGKT